MDATTHRTVRLHATMETELFLDINVPLSVGDDDLWHYYRDGHIDGADFKEDPDSWGGWVWNEHINLNEFNPAAPDHAVQLSLLLEDE
mgnify:FL=1